MEKKKGIYAGMPYSYYGTPMKESEKTVIFYFCGRSEKWQEKAVIKSAVEAVRHGYTIISNGIYRARRALNMPVLKTEGRIRVVLYPSLDEYRIRGEELYVLLSGGSFLSFSESSDFDYSDFKNCSIKMLSLSDKIIFAGPVPSYLADAALDRGMDIAVLKDFLCYESTRRLAKDGAAVIDTFSSWLEYPEHIAYEEMDSGLLYLRVMDF